MNIFESIYLALDSVRVNKLRAFLTLLSISIGVFALMGTGALIKSIDNAVTNEMITLGENTFSIKRTPSIVTGNSWRKYRNRKPITYSQLKELKKNMTSTSFISGFSSSSLNTIKFLNYSTDPDVNLIGTDEEYFYNNNITISQGRALTNEDLQSNKKFAIIGNDVKVKLFENISPLNKTIRIKNQNFEVIGVIEPKGAILGQSQDNQVIIPIQHFLRYFANEREESLTITIKSLSRDDLAETVNESIGLMRVIRQDKPGVENSFEVETNETINEQFGQLTGFLGFFGYASGFIALIAAGVGIMNIMLVSVKERTREIGVRKAVGAKNSWILWQFIIETITLCQIGGIIGILLGLISSLALGGLINIQIIVPTGWLIGSIIICTLLGLIFGAFPAWKASKLNPIDALRYE